MPPEGRTIRIAAWCVSLSAPLAASTAFGQEFLHHVPLFGAVAEGEGGERNLRQGFVRVINNGTEAGEVLISAIDDAGREAGPVTLTLNGGQTRHFNTDDLRNGDAAHKGLDGIIGEPTQGDWRLELTTELDIQVLAYVRTSDGFLTSMHDLAPTENGTHRVATFNPGRNTNQVSKLRIVNLDTELWANVSVRGFDDQGKSGDYPVDVHLPPRSASTLSASDLEQRGLGTLEGGKWRLEVVASQKCWNAICAELPIQVMSLLYSPTGHLANLSTMPATGTTEDGGTTHDVPLFPEHVEHDPSGVTRQGFLRVVNLGDEEATVTITAFDDDAKTNHHQVMLMIAPRLTVHINSKDLEQGNEAKGLSGGVGNGDGTWRLRLTTAEDIRVLAYIRTSDGFLTSMHDLVHAIANRHEVVTFNPGSNTNQKSSLRLINDGDRAATVTITATDDRGITGDGPVEMSVEPSEAMTLSVQDLESGEGLTGALGSHPQGGKWRLIVEATEPIDVMSLLDTPNGHLTNLSTTTTGGDEFHDSWLTELYGDNVLVMHVPDDLTRNASLRFKTYARHFYRWFEDSFDALIFVTNTDYGESDVWYSGIYIGVKNDVDGIGAGVYSSAGEYGSAGRLRGVIHLPNYPGLRGPFLHELMHMWANYAVDTVDVVHFYFTWGVQAEGHLGGFDIEDLVDYGNGRYAWRYEYRVHPYSPLELYFAGLVAPEEVPDRRVAMDGKWLKGEDGKVLEDKNGDLLFTAKNVREYSIDETIAEHGPRVPDWTTAPRHLRAAVIFLVDDAHPITPWLLSWNSAVARANSTPDFTYDDNMYIQNYQMATGGRGSLTFDGLADSRKSAPTPNIAPVSFGAVPLPVFCLMTGDGRIEHLTWPGPARLGHRQDATTASE